MFKKYYLVAKMFDRNISFTAASTLGFLIAVCVTLAATTAWATIIIPQTVFVFQSGNAASVAFDMGTIDAFDTNPAFNPVSVSCIVPTTGCYAENPIGTTDYVVQATNANGDVTIEIATVVVEDNWAPEVFLPVSPIMAQFGENLVIPIFATDNSGEVSSIEITIPGAGQFLGNVPIPFDVWKNATNLPGPAGGIFSFSFFASDPSGNSTFGTVFIDVAALPVPTPETFALIGFGLFGIVRFRRNAS